MAKIKKLEFFKGELNGIYQKLWVGISENDTLFKTSDLIYNENQPDIKNTLWKHISNEHYSEITDGMYLFQEIDFKEKNITKSIGLGM